MIYFGILGTALTLLGIFLICGFETRRTLLLGKWLMGIGIWVFLCAAVYMVWHRGY